MPGEAPFFFALEEKSKREHEERNKQDTHQPTNPKER
jgi:hypothetical protein